MRAICSGVNTGRLFRRPRRDRYRQDGAHEGILYLASIRLDERYIHEELRQEPPASRCDEWPRRRARRSSRRLLFCRLAGHGPRFLEHDLVRVKQPRDLHWNFFASFRRTRNHRCLRDIGRLARRRQERPALNCGKWSTPFCGAVGETF